MVKAIRLDKYLAQAGIGSRSQVKELLKKGKVTVNGQVASKPEIKVTPGEDSVYCCGEQVGHWEHRYFLLNKPAGGIGHRRYPGKNSVGSFSGTASPGTFSGGTTG